MGYLREHVSFWEREMSAPPWVIDTIKHGLILPLHTEPTPYYRPNQLSATSNAEWVDGAITELVKGQYIREVKEKPYVCSPLSVVEQETIGGKYEACKQVSLEKEFQI